MKNIKLFRTKEAYQAYLENEIFTDDSIRTLPFYKNLVQFVVDNKAPIFYEMTDDSEHANFSNYFYWQVIREKYTDQTLRTMFFLHEFTHMLFNFDPNVAETTLDEFTKLFVESEYTASNETELLIHYRIAGLRDLILQDKTILFDRFKEQGIPQPSAGELYEIRKLLVESDAVQALVWPEQDNPFRAEFSRYRGNTAWCESFYKLIEGSTLNTHVYPSLDASNYEREVANYSAQNDQARYEKTVLANMQSACNILGIKPPQSFDECFNVVSIMEGRVFFKEES